MKSLVGMTLDRAKALLEKQGKQIVVIENFAHQSFACPTLVVTNAKEQGNVVTLIVSEFFLGEKDV